MATYTEPSRPLESVLYEMPAGLSREVFTIPDETAAIAANTVLGIRRTTAATGADFAAGNGAFVAESVNASPAAEAGVYILHSISATQTLVYSPSGALLGIHTIATAWDANGIEFNTVGTWAANDIATITVAHTDVVGVYNGTGPALGVALYPVDASEADAKVTAITRLGALVSTALTWGTTVADEKAAAVATMAANNLFVRS